VAAVDWRLEYDADDAAMVLRSSEAYLSIRVTAADLRSLAALDGAAFEVARSVRAGTMLGQPAFWCFGEEQDTAQVLVGPDEQSWELAVTLPLSLVQAAAAKAAAARR
jgi:hypothetical protein